MNININQFTWLKLIHSIFLFCLVSVVEANSSVFSQPSSSQPSLSQQGQANIQQINPGETPEGLTGTEWGGIQAQIAAGKYRAYSNDDGGFVSANPVHGWQISYAKDGTTTLMPREHTVPAYRLGLKLSAIGYKQLNPLRRPQKISAHAATVTYQWNDTLRERWVNSKNDLEQWFILDKRPTGIVNGQPLTLQMTLDSDLKVRLVGNTINFKTPKSTTISYNKLKVWDADGRVLPAKMQLAAQTLSLIVEEANARYPLTIDPSIQQSAYLKASNNGPIQKNARSEFGRTVSIFADTLVIGAPNEGSSATGVNGDQSNNDAPESGAAYVFVRNNNSWIQQAYLKASNTDKADGFGKTVSISGDTLVIGAAFEDGNAEGIDSQSNNKRSDSGAAYVFVRQGNTWSQQAYLKVPRPRTGDEFGSSVSISGDTLVIGASGESANITGVNRNNSDFSAKSSGAAYVFVRSGTEWFQQAYLKASNTDESDGFGESVSISGDSLVIGAVRESSGATGVNGDQDDNSTVISGAAYVFVRSGGVWSQQAYLKASNPDELDRFGSALSISGDTLVVGASDEDSGRTGINGFQNDNSADNAGAVYVFIRTGVTWSQQAYLKSSNTKGFDRFGISLSLSGNTLVVGARGEASNATGIDGNHTDNSASNSGAAYVFVRNGSDWSQKAYIKASNTGTSDFFGDSVSLSGDTFVVGASGEDSIDIGVNGDQDNNLAKGAGAAYVFDLNLSTDQFNLEPDVQQQAYLKASATTFDSYIPDKFGSSIAMSGDTLIVGAPDERSAAKGVDGDQSDNSARNSGAVYVFVRVGSSWLLQAYVKASNTDSGDHFGSSVAISGDILVVGAPGESSTATGVNGDQTINETVYSGFLFFSPIQSGAAYVFVREGTTWSQQAYLKASNTDRNDEFGGSVAISGNLVVVGAALERSNAFGVNGDQSDNSLSGVGAAYIFERINNSWSQQAYLKASNPDALDLFATSVAISGDTVVIGAPDEDSIASGVNGDQGNPIVPFPSGFTNRSPDRNEVGAAYVFNRNGTTWSQEAYLKASNPNLFDQFGAVVSISGNSLVIGAPNEDSNATGINSVFNIGTAAQSGAAYVFVRNNANWSQQAYIKASNTDTGDFFGESVAIFDDMLVIGAPREASTATGVNGDQSINAQIFQSGIRPTSATAGAAYIFVREGVTWNQQAYLKASNTDLTDQFGGSVAISRDFVAIGAIGEASNASGVDGDQDNNIALDTGAVYAFDLTVDVVPPPIDSAELFFQKTFNFSSSWTAFEIPAIQTVPLIGYGPSSFNGVQPGVIRIRPTDAVNGQWQMRFQEYQYLDQFHLQEGTDIMCFTKGVATLDDGSMIVTGVVTVSGNGIWEMIDFPASFAGVPQVFLFAQSAIGGQPPTIHARNVNPSSFEVAIKEEEQLMPSGHVPEDIAFFAIYSPTNQGTVMVNNQPIDFRLQQIQVDHQWKTVPGTNMEIKLEEEQSLDQETGHVKEAVDVMVLGDQLYTQAVTMHGADPFGIRKR